MKPLYPSRLVSASLYVFLLFVSCTKSDNCPDPRTIIIDQNGPVYVGWPLELKAEVQSTAYLYKWSGPNGWEMNYEIFSSDAYTQMRENITMADAGEYRLQMITHEGCVAYEGSVVVDVIDEPTPTCSVAANTSTSSDAGVGGYIFNYTHFYGGGNNYNVTGSQIVAGDHMEFNFLGDERPMPGVYKTSGYFPHDTGQVGLFISTGTYQFVAYPNENVYVRMVNNKLEITFCAVKFNNPLNQARPIVISGRIVE